MKNSTTSNVPTATTQPVISSNVGYSSGPTIGSNVGASHLGNNCPMITNSFILGIQSCCSGIDAYEFTRKITELAPAMDYALKALTYTAYKCNKVVNDMNQVQQDLASQAKNLY